MRSGISIYLTLLFCCILVIGCNKINESKSENSSDLIVKSEELNFTDPSFLSSFNRPKLREYVNPNGETVLYFFDNMLKSIILIDDDKKQAYKKIKLYKEGPNGIPMAMDAYLISDNEIAVVEGLKIYIVDYEGTVLRKMESELPDEFENIFFSFKGANNPLGTDLENLHIVNVPKDQSNISFMSSSALLSMLELESLELSITDVMLPEKYAFKDAYYDLTNLPYVTPYNNKLYLSFRVDKNLFEYDLTSKLLKEVELESIYADPMAKPSLKENYDNTETRYKDLYYTQTFLYPIFTEEYIYRPHSRAKNPDINPSHDMYLSVYDFNLVKEVELEGFGLLSFPFKYKESIAFLDANMSTEGVLTVYTFRLTEAKE